MSYDIYFINRKAVELEDIEEILETEATAQDDFYISKETMLNIKEALESKGLVFESIDEDHEMEFNFPTFQVSLFTSQIAITLPYWDENKSDAIGETVNKICETLEDMGMTGYDPQAETIYSEAFDFMDVFAMTQDTADDYSDELDEDQPKKKWWKFW